MEGQDKMKESVRERDTERYSSAQVEAAVQLC